MSDPIEDCLSSNPTPLRPPDQLSSGALFRRLHLVAALLRAAPRKSNTPPLRLLWRDAQGVVREFPLRGDCVVGRAETSGLVLEENGISRRHCVIRVSSSRAVLEDLGSRNGTRVNDAAVTRHELHTGDVIAVGAQQIVFIGE